MGIASVTKKSGSSRSTPKLVLSEETLQKQVDLLSEKLNEVDTLQGYIDLIKGQLRSSAISMYLDQKTETAKTVSICGTEEAMEFTFSSGYRSEASPAKEFLAEKIPQHADSLFKTEKTLSVNLSGLQEEIGDRYEEFVKEFDSMMSRFNMEAFTKASEKVIPVKDFNEKKMALLSKEDNLLLDSIYPMPSSMKRVPLEKTGI